jgi:hypothetical protein
LFSKVGQIFQKLLMCVCVYIFHCLHFGKADGFCKITSKLVCVFSFVFMCPILETFVLREVLVDKLNFFGSRG